MAGVKALGLWAAVLLVLCTVTSVYAQAPPRQEQVVYTVDAFDGKVGYIESFYPQSENTVYLFAGTNNALEARLTEVYYWAIDRRYRPDWGKLNQLIDGSLEILQGGTVIELLPKVKYVLFHPEGYFASKAFLLVGEDAEQQYTAYKAALQEYFDALEDYSAKQVEYGKQMEQYLEDLREGKDVELPQEPKPPGRPVFYVTEPQEAYIVNLPAGNYRMRVKTDEGNIVAGTQKDLVVFSARREGIGYTIIPASKWTVPDRSDEIHDTIYVSRNAVLYLTPYLEREYDSILYGKALNPQARTGKPGQWVWAYVSPKSEGQLEAQTPKALPVQVQYKEYHVQQLPDVPLGYEIIEYDADQMPLRRPSFGGYKLVFKDADRGTIQVLDSDGRPVSGSIRQIRVMRTGNLLQRHGPALIPLVAGVAIVLWRRRQTRMVA